MKEENKQYICREELLSEIREYANKHLSEDQKPQWIIPVAIIEAVPKSDVVEVVRCNDCIHYYDETCLKIYEDGDYAQNAILHREPDDFCSYGIKIHEVAPYTIGGAPTYEQLKIINEMASSKFNSDQVYVFPLRLCDDQIDRDFERFDTDSLDTLAKLFIGKTGIIDERIRTESQKARIFDSQVVEENGISYIKAFVYIVCERVNHNIIMSINSGEQNRVSIGCAMGNAICSICGKEYGSCEHKKRVSYGDKICHAILKNPIEAYEFSFEV